ncbi:MAG: CBS domain-containing protein [Pirellulaceae bacterium]|nr:CBS domain-containing protein [Pirellulaceae bacterium]MDP7018169.1 CBS domain-containing protein [Pirellulaceae bacterium]
MFISDVLCTKGVDVHSVGPDVTTDHAVRQLVRYNIGSLVVFGSDGRRRRMLGIVTERDILRAQANRRKPLERLLVREVMSVEVVCTTVDKPLTDAMRLMTEHRIRHLPVVDDNGELFGIVSIGDIVKAQHDELVAENHFMRTYIRG